MIVCRPIGGQAAGAAGRGEPGWPAGEPHGYRGYGVRHCERQPAQLHRITGGRSQGTDDDEGDIDDSNIEDEATVTMMMKI